MSGTSPFSQVKRGRRFHGDGITVNKKVQTGESTKAGVSFRFDAAYPLNNGGSFSLDAGDASEMDGCSEDLS